MWLFLRKKKGDFEGKISFSVNTGIKTGVTSVIIFLRSWGTGI